MNDTLEMKRGDTSPTLEVTVTDPEATFANAVSWRVLIRRGSELIIDPTPTVVPHDSETPHRVVISHDWQPAETNVAKTLLVEVEATWPGGTIQTFPYSGFLRTVIHSDLG